MSKGGQVSPHCALRSGRAAQIHDPHNAPPHGSTAFMGCFECHSVSKGFVVVVVLLIIILKIVMFTYFQKNGTNDGDYVFLTGEDNYLNFTKIVEWNGKT